MEQPDLDEVEKLIAQRTTGLRAGVADIRGSFRNRAFANMNPGNAGLPTAPNTGSVIIVGGALINVLGSGIFQASANFTVTGATPTDTLVVDVASQTNTSLALSVAGVKVGPGNNSSLAPLQNAGAYTSNAGAGISVTSSGPIAIAQYGTGTYVFGTGASTATFGWEGVIMNSVLATAETPFTRGNQVFLYVSMNLSGGTLVFQSFSISLVELP